MILFTGGVSRQAPLSGRTPPTRQNLPGPGRPPWTRQTPPRTRQTPPRSGRHPLDQADPPQTWQIPPIRQNPPQTRQTPPGPGSQDQAGTHYPPDPPGPGSPPPPPGRRLQHMVNERPVRILLECILVTFCE